MIYGLVYAALAAVILIGVPIKVRRDERRLAEQARLDAEARRARRERNA